MVSEYCPICGVHVGSERLVGGRTKFFDRQGGELLPIQQHVCSRKRIAAIEGANTRAGNDELEPTGPEPFGRTRECRLSEGFKLLELGGDDVG